MAKKNEEQQINLLPQEEFENSTLGRTIKWLLTTFRYIVIGTEMIVMVAFLSRFWLDAKSATLIDGINQKKAIIASYSTFENQFRATQNKLKIYTTFSSDKEKVSPIVTSITALVPDDIILQEINLVGNKVLITALTQNENSAARFVKSLNSSTFISNAFVSSVESKSGNTAITINITATLKGKAANGI